MEVSPQNICSLCTLSGHFSKDCPFEGSKCTIEGCKGFLFLMKALVGGVYQPYGSKCTCCGFFYWIDERLAPHEDQVAKINLLPCTDQCCDGKMKLISSPKKLCTGTRYYLCPKCVRVKFLSFVCLK